MAASACAIAAVVAVAATTAATTDTTNTAMKNKKETLSKQIIVNIADRIRYALCVQYVI